MEVNNPVCKENTLPGISKQGLKLKKKAVPENFHNNKLPRRLKTLLLNT